MSDPLNNLKKFLDSPEGKESMRKYAEELVQKERRQDARIELFHKTYSGNLDAVMERLMAKYESDEYRDREYKLGYEPREPLYWFIFKYAEKHCEPCTDEKYWNTFTAEAYYFGSYVIQVMIGQGSVIKIDKQHE